MNDVVRAQIGTRGPQLSTKRFGRVPGVSSDQTYLSPQSEPLIFFRLCFSWSTLLLGNRCCKEKGIKRAGGGVGISR